MVSQGYCCDQTKYSYPSAEEKLAKAEVRGAVNKRWSEGYNDSSQPFLVFFVDDIFEMIKACLFPATVS